MNKVEIYTSNTCGYCHKAKEFFEENNVNYVEHNISTDDDAKKDLIKMGFRSVPIITINEETIVGFDEDKISEVLGL